MYTISKEEEEKKRIRKYSPRRLILLRRAGMCLAGFRTAALPAQDVWLFGRRRRIIGIRRIYSFTPTFSDK